MKNRLERLHYKKNGTSSNENVPFFIIPHTALSAVIFSKAVIHRACERIIDYILIVLISHEIRAFIKQRYKAVLLQQNPFLSCIAVNKLRCRRTAYDICRTFKTISRIFQAIDRFKLIKDRQAAVEISFQRIQGNAVIALRQPFL